MNPVIKGFNEKKQNCNHDDVVIQLDEKWSTTIFRMLNQLDGKRSTTIFRMLNQLDEKRSTFISIY